MKFFRKMFGWFFTLVRNISIKVKIILLVFFPAIGIVAFFSFTFYDTYTYMHANTELKDMIDLSVNVSFLSVEASGGVFVSASFSTLLIHKFSLSVI